MENIDIDNAISPTFINTTKKPYRNCHTIKDSSGTTTIGYTIKNGDYYWFYAPVKKPQPTLKTATFYTSTGKSFAVVLKDDGTLDIEKNKELAQTHYADNQEVLDTIKKVKQAEIVDFDGESMLFALLDDNSMKGFAGAENSKFQLAFKADGASSMDGTIVPNLTTVKKASWVDEKLPIQKYREIKNGDTVIGYTFQNEAHHWFYAPATVKETKAFYTSTNREFKVVLNEDKTVDVEATKIYLAPLKEKLPDDLKALADSATDTDVVIEEINGVHILFVDLKTSTKAFADQQDSAFKDAFKDGTVGEPFYDAATIIKADWVDGSKEITHYNEIKN